MTQGVDRNANTVVNTNAVLGRHLVDNSFQSYPGVIKDSASILRINDSTATLSCKPEEEAEEDSFCRIRGDSSLLNDAPLNGGVTVGISAGDGLTSTDELVIEEGVEIPLDEDDRGEPHLSFDLLDADDENDNEIDDSTSSHAASSHFMHHPSVVFMSAHEEACLGLAGPD